MTFVLILYYFFITYCMKTDNMEKLIHLHTTVLFLNNLGELALLMTEFCMWTATLCD